MSAAKDKIESLPGAPAFSSDQYSGFLHITPTKSIHYIYYESEKNPVTDSIIFWTNGGPGCSGLLGLFTELGPWRPLYNGTLIRNPASWTSLASLVFLEQPVGVGFSKTSDKSELELNDYMAARDNLLTIKEFLKRFPERINNTMYIASESYGGHYIPQLTIALLADKELSNRFEGFLVGNPFVSYGSGDIAFIQTLWGLQLIDYPLWYVRTNNCLIFSFMFIAYINSTFVLNVVSFSISSFVLYDFLYFIICSFALMNNPHHHFFSRRLSLLATLASSSIILT